MKTYKIKVADREYETLRVFLVKATGIIPAINKICNVMIDGEEVVSVRITNELTIIE